MCRTEKKTRRKENDFDKNARVGTPVVKDEARAWVARRFRKSTPRLATSWSARTRETKTTTGTDERATSRRRGVVAVEDAKEDVALRERNTEEDMG